jgi:hypothetical protein
MPTAKTFPNHVHRVKRRIRWIVTEKENFRMSFRIFTAGLLVSGVILCAQPQGNYIILDLSSSTEMGTAADGGKWGIRGKMNAIPG